MKYDNLHEELTMLISSTLLLDCPRLSGNMVSHIKMDELSDDFARISISAPVYDVALWQKTGEIKYIKRFYNETDYAVSVNNVGAFWGKSTKSKHWANKSVVKACRIIASKYGAEVIVNVEL